MRPSTGILAVSTVFAELAASQSSRYPADIHVAVVSPRRQTYDVDLSEVPVAFAIEGARAIHHFGFRLNWEFRPFNDDGAPLTAPFASGTFESRGSRQPPLTTVDDNDVWFGSHVERSVFTRERQGQSIRLFWTFRMTYCTDEGTQSVGIEQRIVNGTVDFMIDEDAGSLGQNVTYVDLRGHCPSHEATYRIGGTNDGGCPFFEPFQGSEPDFCDPGLDREVVDCAMSNLGGNGTNTAACESVRQRTAERRNREGTDWDGTSDGNGDENSASELKWNGSGSGFVLAASAFFGFLGYSML